MQDRLARLLQAVEGTGEILILPHNDPDPDAIASSVALRHLLAEKAGVEGRIAYRGIIGRAENRALVRFLAYPLERLTRSEWHQGRPVALVDTQPGAANNSFPASSLSSLCLAFIFAPSNFACSFCASTSTRNP